MRSQKAADSTSLSYWLNWRVFLCSIWVLAPVVVALFIIRKYEDGTVETRAQGDDENDNDDDDNDDKRRQSLCVDDVWRPCLNQIHPGWLLGFRVLAFCFLLATTLIRLLVRGWSIYFYYTQWTFTLLTIYFGLGSLLSIYGCLQCERQQNIRVTTDQARIDSENGYCQPLIGREDMVIAENREIRNLQEVSKALKECVRIFQIIFQTSAGAIMLTDCIYWGVIFPFLAIQDYDLNFMTVNLHSSNLVLLLCDTALNSLRFPLFRFSYFILWTASFVIAQWIVHACISLRWPYPFLDLSSPMAPLWYLIVALMHLPCYGFFAIMVRIKHKLLSK